MHNGSRQRIDWHTEDEEDAKRHPKHHSESAEPERYKIHNHWITAQAPESANSPPRTRNMKGFPPIAISPTAMASAPSAITDAAECRIVKTGNSPARSR